MNSLKNLIIIAVLAAAGYGIYTSLSRNNVDSGQSSGLADGWPAAPKVELPSSKATLPPGGPLPLSGEAAQSSKASNGADGLGTGATAPPIAPPIAPPLAPPLNAGPSGNSSSNSAGNSAGGSTASLGADSAARYGPARAVQQSRAAFRQPISVGRLGAKLGAAARQPGIVARRRYGVCGTKSHGKSGPEPIRRLHGGSAEEA